MSPVDFLVKDKFEIKDFIKRIIITRAGYKIGKN